MSEITDRRNLNAFHNTRLLKVHNVVQSQKAVYAYFTSKQILPFDFAGQRSSIEKDSTYIPGIRNLSLYHDVDHNIARRISDFHNIGIQIKR